MHTPDRGEFLNRASRGNLIPVYRQLRGDVLTPVLAMARLDNAKQAFLLESVTGGEKISRFSFLGVNPALILKAYGNRVELINSLTGESETREPVSPLDTIDEIIQEYKPVHSPDLPRFTGGAVGYFAYDVVRQIEELPDAPARSLGLPDIYLGIYKTMLVFDHVNQTCKVVSHADCRNQDPEAAYLEACKEVDELIGKLSAPGELPVDEVPAIPDEEPVFSSNFKKEEYKAAVVACKEYIKAGDIFQVVISQRLEAPCDADPFQVYRNIRIINPSPYMFYLKYPQLALVGASPEVMVRVEDDKITVRPIAGTRPRGANEAEDADYAKDLLADPKELAEHTMLLDLGRNDVGRVAEYGTVRITEEMVIEKYSHVMHIVSNVEGTQQRDLTALDTFKACLPAGTVSGAPKIRAMEIIDEFEPDVRGPYAGAVGYIDFSGNLDTCITIRTMLLHDGKAYVQAGAGIVADSVPETEYEETQSKAKALLRAVQVTR